MVTRFLLLITLMSGLAFCAPPDQVIQETLLKLSNADGEIKNQALTELAKTGDARLERVFEAYKAGSLYLWKNQIVLCPKFEEKQSKKWASLLDPLNEQPLSPSLSVPAEELKEMAPNRKERIQAGIAICLLKLFSKNPDLRLAGVKKCGEPPIISGAKERLKELSETDPVSKVRRLARESLQLIAFEETLKDTKSVEHLAIVKELGEIASTRALQRVEESYKQFWKEESERKKLYFDAIQNIKTHQIFVDRVGAFFQGLSLGSVLILMALGLAITFGLMGVINMAHGELMMIGAFATYQVQLVFMGWIQSGKIAESAYDWYYVLAIPVSFFAAAGVGALMEVLIVRHLYNRPIESLLATWGAGLILIQMARLHYGDNVGVNAPTWARGGVEIFQDVILPYSRIFILALCAVCVAAIYFLMNRTRIGLLIRATMQNRPMAKSMGVNTSRVDLFTFAFGSGIAGVAGCAWTLIGGVTPDMGQKNFIVDSFLVVVTGGVGEIVGVIFAGLGIGSIIKILEPLQLDNFVVGAIWAKVLLLAMIVIFIQFKPAGLFAPKGRQADL